MELSEIRNKIDALDDELVKLFIDRMKLSSLVAQEKAKTGKAVSDPEREKEIIKKLTENLDDEMSEYVTDLYNSIFEISKKRQNKIISKE